MDWKERYPDRKKRPGIEEIRAYLSPDVMDLYTRFANHLSRAYHLHCDPAVYVEGDGWTFRFGTYGMYITKGIVMCDGCFHVEGITVRDEDGLNEALARMDRHWVEGFGAELAVHSAQKRAEQAARAKAKRESEKKQDESLADRPNLNRYRWSPKISRRDLAKLYESDANRIEDEELADEIGYTLYARCVQGKEERALMLTGKLKCHNCGNILPCEADILTCACGRRYQFRSYMRSFRENNMPANAASAIFNEFIEKWPIMRTYRDKMRLIDWLIHEFHLNLSSGVKGRFVAINLIEGTKTQIKDLILSLASAEGGSASKDAFMRHLEKR